LKLLWFFQAIGGLYMLQAHTDRKSNRLKEESSPYLRQHAHNPVDWYPWGVEALSRARSEDKPILLSIGYSACHWCHVMEHESFENPEIASLMNANFINIKVDREERPDLDQIYQNVAQLMTRSGGWPLTVFLTPDLKPYFGATYFPPEDRQGRPGFPRVLQALSDAYQNDRASVTENARRLTDAIGQITATRTEGHKRPDAASMRKVIDSLMKSVDWPDGGFGAAPKFPNTMGLTLLWRFGVATSFGMAKEAATVALTKMARGGIYDQIGGGFHRYSVDQTWTVPHFEKMLYDNALLLKAYSEVLLSEDGDLSKEDRALFERVVADTVKYVLREMKSPEGAFYSTQDADSEGEEGKFFVWNKNSIRTVLTEEEAVKAESYFGISDKGNFEESGDTVLQLVQMSEDFELIRQKLFNAREKRIKPARDEKIISSWNGLMISGLVWASLALEKTAHGEVAELAYEAAIVAMDFFRTHMTHDQNRLWSVYKDRQARFQGYLDDYAFLAQAALDLTRNHEDQSEIESLQIQAKSWVDIARKHFVDPDGGFFFTADDHEALITRPKTLYDQAIPSGNAVMISTMFALAEITGDAKLETEADEHLYKFFPTVEQTPNGMAELACTALMRVCGIVTVSGRNAHLACTHPHIFQKENSATHELLVCHKKTCDLPYTNPEVAQKAAWKKTKLEGALR